MRLSVRERGQTLPFWVLGVMACLALTFFVANYANVLRWQIRAQNAADNGTAAALVPDANIDNQITLQLYSEAVDEVRIRALNQAILNNLQGYGCTGNCDQDYLDLVAAFNNAVATYYNLLQSIQVANNMTQGGLQYAYANAWALASSGTNCTVFDCAFAYNSLDLGPNLGPDSSERVDGYVCKNVPNILPRVLGLAPQSSFKAIARAASTLVPIPETFNPGTVNPKTGIPYQPLENPATNDKNTYYNVDFSGLTVNVNFYQPGPTAPYTTFSQSNAVCS